MREVANRRPRREPLHERGQIAPQQRLAAGQPDLVDAERREDVDQRLDLLEVQDVLARQPHVVLLRHAVAAAQVAAVGDRQAQVPQRPLMSVENHCWLIHVTPDLRCTDRRLRSWGRNGVAVRCPAKPRAPAAWKMRPAGRASAVGVERVLPNQVAVARDQPLRRSRWQHGVFEVADAAGQVAGVDVAQACLVADAAARSSIAGVVFAGSVIRSPRETP